MASGGGVGRSEFPWLSPAGAPASGRVPCSGVGVEEISVVGATFIATAGLVAFDETTWDGVLLGEQAVSSRVKIKIRYKILVFIFSPCGLLGSSCIDQTSYWQEDHLRV
jgi:hypothetical protein